MSLLVFLTRVSQTTRDQVALTEDKSSEERRDESLKRKHEINYPEEERSLPKFLREHVLFVKEDTQGDCYADKDKSMRKSHKGLF